MVGTQVWVSRAALREEMLVRYETLGQWAKVEREIPFPLAPEVFLKPAYLHPFAHRIAKLVDHYYQSDPALRAQALDQINTCPTQYAWDEFGMEARMIEDQESIDRSMEESLYQAEQKELVQWRDQILARHLVGIPFLDLQHVDQWQPKIEAALKEAHASTRELVARYGPPYPATQESAEFVQKLALQ